MDRVNYLFYQLFLKIKYEKRRYFLYVLSFYVGLLLPTCCIANTRSVEQVIYYTTFKGMEDSFQVDWLSRTFTGKNINKKDFMRSWTHSRTAQHISFDELLEEGTTVDGELLFDIADPRSEFESEIIHKFYMEDFKAQLPGVDSKILQMRYDGHSLKEIAAAVGFKTPSAVSKHVEKIAERYDNFISDEYGKLLSKCIN